MITRLLLLSVFWLTEATAPLFSLFEHSVSLRDLILLGGSLFLLAERDRDSRSVNQVKKKSAPLKRRASSR